MKELKAVTELPASTHDRWGGAITARDRTVRSILPGGFQAYGRILHPAWRAVRGDSNCAVSLTKDIRAEPVAWADIAACQKKAVGRYSGFGEICGPMVGIERSLSDNQGWTYPPDEGVMLAPKMLSSLFDILAGGTDRAMGCNCGFWTGYDVRRSPKSLRFRSGYETYWLYRTTLGTLADWWVDRDTRLGLTGDTPDMFWPDNESWFIATPFNAQSTYIGGDPRLIGEILAADDLEAFKVELSDPLWRPQVKRSST